MATELAHGRIESVASAIGTQREYETVIIIRPDTAKGDITSLIQRMQGVFEDRGGRLIKIDSWGMRILAFPVERCRKGIYLYWRYLGGSDMVAEFERHMRLSDRVIRFYTVRIDDDIDPNARPSELTEELLESVAEPGPDPDDLARQAAEEAARRHAERRDDDDDDEVEEGQDVDEDDFVVSNDVGDFE